MDKIIKNARINGELSAIVIENGRITGIGSAVAARPGAEIIDAEGLTVIPGLVDVHVHFREPGLTEKETIATGSSAAAAGGFTTVLAMPNVLPVVDQEEQLKKQLALNSEKGLVKVGQIAAITEELTSNRLTKMAALKAIGAASFSNDGHGIQEAKTMLSAMEDVRKVGGVLTVHLEDNGLANGGVVDPKAGKRLNLPGLTALSESTQLARDIELVRATGARYHVAHVSSRYSVELIRQAKLAGLPITAEVSPHHLFLDESMIKGDDSNFKMNPPLRTKEDRYALIAGLLDGTIDMIASDHAPHTKEDKAGSMADCAFGIVGLETTFALVYERFVASGLVDLQTAVSWLNEKPIEAFGLSNAGRLQVGDPADLVIFDEKEAFRINPADFHSKGRNTPFAGERVHGRVKRTFVNGEEVFSEK